MASKNKLLQSIARNFVLYSISTTLYSVEYPELMAKQSNENIRLISKDGKYTYYQKKSGSLHFSTNYSLKEVLKSEPGTQYTLLSTPARKQIVIQENPLFNQQFTVNPNEKIYLINFGGYTPKMIGHGSHARLHLQDKWLSYFDSKSKKIFFQNTENEALKFNISINARINPFFYPQVIMIDETTILFSDLNADGSTGIFKLERQKNNLTLLEKVISYQHQIELVACNQRIIILKKAHPHLHVGTEMYLWNFNLEQTKLVKPIYQSQLADPGSLQCDYDDQHKLYFIKNTGSTSKPEYDAFIFDLESYEIKRLTYLFSNTSLINMDGVLLSIDRGKLLVIKGSNLYKESDLLNPLSTQTSGDVKAELRNEN